MVLLSRLEACLETQKVACLFGVSPKKQKVALPRAWLVMNSAKLRNRGERPAKKAENCAKKSTHVGETQKVANPGGPRRETKQKVANSLVRFEPKRQNHAFWAEHCG
jgi:hypothetical protein